MNPTDCRAALPRLAASGVRFGTVYADPPWPYRKRFGRGAAARHYPTMPVEDICALPVAELAADQSLLWLWTTNAFLFECPRLFAAWGFEFKWSFVWCKPQMGLGNYWRVSHEFLLLAVRGNLPSRGDAPDSWGVFPRGRHSEKPEPVRKMVERVSPGPRLELFARRPADGWVVWGDEVADSDFEAGLRGVRRRQGA